MVIWGGWFIIVLPTTKGCFFQHFPIALAAAHEVSREVSEVIGEGLKVFERLAPMMGCHEFLGFEHHMRVYI
jgi:hypothetical protein